MTFMHKLSRRLAQAHATVWVVVLLALVAACQFSAVAPNAKSVTQLVVSPESVTVDPGQQIAFLAQGRTAAGDTVAVPVGWSATGGTIGPTGLFTADTTTGDFSVSATSSTLGMSEAARVHVRLRPVASVTVTPTLATVSVGQTAQLSATPSDSNGNPLSGRTITWGSSDTAVATINGSGLATGVRAGSANITATTGGQTGTAALTVTTVAVASVSVSPATASVTTGQTVSVAATPEDANGNPLSGRVITWASGTPAVATVSTSGLVTGVAAGSATITATSEGKSGTAAVTVTLVPVASVTVSPATTSIVVGQTAQLTAVPRDASGNPLTGRTITWATSNVAFATVAAAGLVTGIGAGSATITATSGGQKGTAVVTVTAATGGVVLLQESFADANFAARGWYDNTSETVTSANSPPGPYPTGSTSALVAHWTQGATDPFGSGSLRHLFTATPTLYISYWVQYSANWVGSGVAYHPHEFVVLSDQDGDYDGGSDEYLAVYVEQNYQNGGIPRMSWQDSKLVDTSYGAPPISLIGITTNRSTGGCNGVDESTTAGGDFVSTCYAVTGNDPFPDWYNAGQIDAPGEAVYFQPNPGTGYKGNWNHVEAYYQINSIVNGVGQPDGVMQYWFNGTLVIDRHDIMFRAGGAGGINFHQLMISPYMGVGSPVDQTAWYTQLTVATAHP